jgi:hypothetical protein
MKNFHLCWVPHQLTDDLKQVRVAKCGEFLHELEDMQRTHFRHVVTGNESTFYLEYQHASQWSVSRHKVPQRTDPVIGTAKFMFMAIWGVNNFHLLDLILSQCRFNAQFLVEHVMAPLVQTVFPQGRIRYTPRLNVHLDNCYVHLSNVTEQFSSRINGCMFPTQLMVPTWHCRSSGYSGVSKLDSLAEPSPVRKIIKKCSRIYGGNSCYGTDGGFRGLD